MDNSRRHNPSTSKKRTRFNSDDGKRKRLNYRQDDGPMSSQPIETVYRILCPGNKIGGILGRGGHVVNALRDETKAKIRVADSIPGADERVIIIFDYQNNSKQAVEAIQNNIDGLENMKPHCFAQDALLKIHDKIAADEDPNDGVICENSETAGHVTARILVPGNQVGCLLGKGGSIIQQLRNDTGAGIRVLPSENLPQCALKSDELVQISGAASLVRKALYEISTRLHMHPRKENPPLEEIIDASTQRKRGSPPPIPHENHMLPHLHVDHPPPMPLLDPYRNRPLQYPVPEPEEFSIRILCASELIGPVIGRSGANVRQVEQQTGARIVVQELHKDASGERLIVISSKEIPADPVSPTIEALILLHSKVSASKVSEPSESEPSEEHKLVTRLVVPSKKVGCILGEGGKVITEMRRRIGAEIRVYSKADKPKYLSFNEELVQVSGSPDIAREALTEIASRLRDRILRDGISSFDGPPADIFPSREFTQYGRPVNPPYGRLANDTPYGRLANDTPYGRLAHDTPYGRPANDSPYQRRLAIDQPYGLASDSLYGRPANDPLYGRPANDPPYGGPANDTAYGRPANDTLYGRPNNKPHDSVDYFSKRRAYPNGSPFASDAPPSASYDRYAGSTRLPTREMPLPVSPGADYMPHRSHHDHMPTDSYASRGMQQLGLSRAGNSTMQQLGVTRAGNSNAYDYTEAAGQMHGREDYQRAADVTGYSSSSVELRIPNSSLESVVGAGGVNLAEIRQISGARMKLLEARPGSSESIMEIQGMAHQVRVAQSLLQGFIGANSQSAQPSQSSRDLYPVWN
ncbi:KH domain-containing protein [Hordeum vulgare]|uniref:KH domain-containing protein At4g18375-like n=1 Tax=Hordeum vulgare subsp. vulgare TaxID=112509 RepID=UPI00029597EE|nr:KH domain-containing protein At4g18375-like [Hordeum vulgare subsp. vulgare]KAE8775408.1 KH domain-containing protein [Hordeum vulgare]